MPDPVIASALDRVGEALTSVVAFVVALRDDWHGELPAADAALLGRATDRGLDRAAQLESILTDCPGGAAPTTLAAEATRCRALLRRRYAAFRLRGISALPDLPLSERERLAVAVLLTTAVSNTVRHTGRPEAAITARTLRRALHLTVLDGTLTHPGSGARSVARSSAADGGRFRARPTGAVGEAIGFGRGLSVAASAAGRAGGTLRATRTDDGARVELSFPTDSPPAPALEERARRVLECVTVHGVATPLLEARWMLPPAAARELGGLLAALDRAASHLDLSLVVATAPAA